MSITVIGSPLKSPCYLIEYDEVKIMLDCGLSISRSIVDKKIKYDIPNFDLIDVSLIDIVLITNHENLAALPYLYKIEGFKGKIYCTQPTMEMGRILLFDMNKSIDETNNSYYNLDEKLVDGENSKKIKKIYNKKEIISLFLNIKVINNHEKICISNITLYPILSGYTFGSISWVIETINEKIIYMGKTSLYTKYCSPAELDHFVNATIIIIGFNIFDNNEYNENYHKIINDCVINVNKYSLTIFPIKPVGQIYSLIQDISQKLIDSSLKNNIYFISPVSKSSLNYLTMFSEWTSSNTRKPAFIPSPIFKFDELIDKKRLFISKHPSDITIDKNSIIFCTHPSFIFGAILHYMECPISREKSKIIITDLTEKIDYNINSMKFDTIKYELNDCISYKELIKILSNSKDIKQILSIDDIRYNKVKNLKKLTKNVTYKFKCNEILNEILIDKQLAEDIIINDSNNKSYFSSTPSSDFILQPLCQTFIRTYDIKLDEINSIDCVKNLIITELQKNNSSFNINVIKTSLNSNIIKIDNQPTVYIQQINSKIYVKIYKNDNISDKIIQLLQI